jgi:hypothetical protein
MQWVFDHSPYELGTRLVHLAIADSVNDENGNEWWGGDRLLAQKARVSVRMVERARATMIADGLLTPTKIRHPSGNKVYRFEMPRPDNLSGAPTRQSVGSDPTSAAPALLSNSSDLKSSRQRRDGGEKPQPLRLVETVRPPTDAERLALEMLAALASNGCRLPKTANGHAPERWVKDFDLLLRVDERPLAEVRSVLAWVMNDDFEKANVLSPGKFRARYDSLRLKAKRGAIPQSEVTEIVSHIRSAITSYGVRRRADAMADLLPVEQAVVEKVGWGALCSSASADLAGLVRSALVRGAS